MVSSEMASQQVPALRARRKHLMSTQSNQFAATPTDEHDKPKHRGERVAALAAAILATVELLTGCGQTVPDNQPVTTSQTGSNATAGNGTEQDQSQEQLNIAGTWLCMFDQTDAPLRYPFIIDNNDSSTINIGLGLSLGPQPASLTIKPNQISWTDTYTNPKGLDVTLDLNAGGLEGASGHYLNNFNGKTFSIADCQTYSTD